MPKRLLILGAAVISGTVIFFLWGTWGEAHQDGCHRWHSCPSDTGSYVCGDLGYCSECPNNQYCQGGQPRRTPPPPSPSPPPPAPPPSPPPSPPPPPRFEAVPGDYDGDGQTDLAVRNSFWLTWHILLSTTGQVRQMGFGWSALIPVLGDYDGDGKTDLAVRDPQSSTWYIVFSSTGQLWAPQFGWSALIPIPKDYDGDGRTDIALFDPEQTIWYILLSRTGQLRTVPFGR